MPLPVIRWRKPEKIIFAGVVLFGVFNLLLNILIALGVSW